MSYRPLDEKTVLEYVRNNNDLQQIIDAGANVTAEEVGDGN